MSDPLVISLPTEIVINNPDALFAGIVWGYLLTGLFFGSVLIFSTDDFEEEILPFKLFLLLTSALLWPLFQGLLIIAFSDVKEERDELKEELEELEKGEVE